ncbi:hypothetical protein [Acuticoccus sediminis]|uniref:hypothetical protein n=1 Tax=Acuticoccus sediminis TaxID=2184697 RepID=UPI001CFE6AF2|nr:hypothetical protein [Acuticoccus sediminis]
MAKPNHSAARSRQNAPEADDRLGATDLASDIMGNNQLQGDNQANVHNQRNAWPDVKTEPDADPVDSAKMVDKDARARAELNKGGGVHPGKASEGDER